jgi:hypothetical protein
VNRPQRPGGGPCLRRATDDSPHVTRHLPPLRTHRDCTLLGPRVRLQRWCTAVALVAASVIGPAAQAPLPEPIRGLSDGLALADAYDAILNADFEDVAPRLATACESVPVWCDVLAAVAVWWRIALDPDDHRHDADFVRQVDTAIAAAEAWTTRESHRAEAWFALGAAYGARAQWRVERNERLAAARDGKRIRTALEHALSLDPALHDAKFGLGMYRYYADVAPAALRVLRWLLLLPGGDRKGGLQQMLDARERGFVVRGEAEYQLHLIYLWYENRSREALTMIQGLQERYPRNPLFVLIEAEIRDVYFHDTNASTDVLRALIVRAEQARVNQSALAWRRAHASLAALRARDKH